MSLGPPELILVLVIVLVLFVRPAGLFGRRTVVRV